MIRTYSRNQRNFNFFKRLFSVESLFKNKLNSKELTFHSNQKKAIDLLTIVENKYFHHLKKLETFSIELKQFEKEYEKKLEIEIEKIEKQDEIEKYF